MAERLTDVAEAFANFASFQCPRLTVFAIRDHFP